MFSPKKLPLLIAASLYAIGSQAGGLSDRFENRMDHRSDRLQIRPQHRLPSSQGYPAPEAALGRLLYADENLSLNRNQSCASCHSLEPARDPLTDRKLPSPGFVDPDNVSNGTAVSDGSEAGRFGRLNAPSVGYAAFSPFFHWNGDEGLYAGGQFWNGRANTLADQAGAPFLNPDEMAMPSQWAVVTRLKENQRYLRLFKKVYDIDLDLIPAYEQAPAHMTPPPGAFAAYDAMATAIGEFEKSRLFNRFDSKFDFVEAGVIDYTEQEQRGADLFDTKAQCAACHVAATIAPDGSDFPALLTDFTYDNLGVPRNVNIPGNPEPDPGLGGRPDITEKDPAGNEIGKHKVMSLRNIALTPPYMHNGVFQTLEQVVHFYNTRDVMPRVCVDNNDPGFGIDCWPEPEFAATMNVDELVNLDLTPEEEADIVAYLKTFTDDYPKWGKDPAVPPGTPSPYADTPFPPLP